MHVSYGELIRISPESIRMTGFTYGQADDCVEAVVWSECVLGVGYKLLRQADERRGGKAWPAHDHAEHEDGRASLDLKGGPIFAYAARIADYAQAAVEARGTANVSVHGGFGGHIAPYVAFRLSRGGCHAAVLWQPAESDQDAPALVSVTAPRPEASARQWIMAGDDSFGMPDQTGADIAELSQELVNRILSGRSDPRQSLLSVIAVRPVPNDRRVDANIALRSLGLPLWGVIESGKRLRRAIEQGIDVSPDRHRILTALSQRIRLPNSARSRAQAG